MCEGIESGGRMEREGEVKGDFCIHIVIYWKMKERMNVRVFKKITVNNSRGYLIHR